MFGNTMALTAGVSDGTGLPASSRVPVNLRVSCEAGLIGILPEALTFSGTSVAGTWVSGCVRVTVNGMPAINGTSAGTAVNASGVVTGPLQITQPSTRLQTT